MITEEQYQERLAKLLGELTTLMLERERSRGEETKSLSPTGKVRGMQEMIWSYVSAHPGMTSAEIADALFQPAFGITRDLFRRRVIVVVSALHKAGKLVMRNRTMQVDDLTSRTVAVWHAVEPKSSNEK